MRIRVTRLLPCVAYPGFDLVKTLPEGRAKTIAWDRANQVAPAARF